jgi:hypothetical protein
VDTPLEHLNSQLSTLHSQLRDTATGPDYKFMFYDPATNRQPTDEQLLADWDAASKLLRRYYPNANLESTSAGDGYTDVRKMRMHREAKSKNCKKVRNFG